jgi:hypothetical protein
MTGETSPANGEERRGAFELRQTRSLTAAELQSIERDWSLLLRNSMDGDGWYRVLGYLTYAFFGFLILSIAMAVFAIDQQHGYLPAQLAVALVGTTICWIAADRRSRRLQRRIYADRHQEGNRYLLGDRGIEIVSPTSRVELFWGSITDMANNDQRLVLLIGKSSVLSLVNASFAGQDVQGFCTELLRRWQQTRKSPQPEAAP